LRRRAPPCRQHTFPRILKHCIKNLGILQGFSLVNVLFIALVLHQGKKQKNLAFLLTAIYNEALHGL
jgi:hypothetical protein